MMMGVIDTKPKPTECRSLGVLGRKAEPASLVKGTVCCYGGFKSNSVYTTSVNATEADRIAEKIPD